MQDTATQTQAPFHHPIDDSGYQRRARQVARTWEGYKAILAQLGFDPESIIGDGATGTIKVTFPCCGTQQPAHMSNLRKYLVNCRNHDCVRHGLAPTKQMADGRSSGAPTIPAPNAPRARRGGAPKALSRAARADHDIGELQVQVAAQRTQIAEMLLFHDQAKQAFKEIAGLLEQSGLIPKA